MWPYNAWPRPYQHPEEGERIAVLEWAIADHERRIREGEEDLETIRETLARYINRSLSQIAMYHWPEVLMLVTVVFGIMAIVAPDAAQSLAKVVLPEPNY
jgi:hypothetical protein